VSASLSAGDTRALVLDIEGTTTPVEFVYQVLFPFARAHAAEYLDQEWGSEACRAALGLLRAEHAADAAHHEMPPAWIDAPLAAHHASAAAYVGWLMDRDRKSSGLKALQGEIWRRGYQSGELRGHVFPDVSPALARWHGLRLEVFIYSSGSVLAQRLLFQTTSAGDLTRFLSGYFDLAVGPKGAPDSYRRIAEMLGAPAAHLLFISDTAAELDAASVAGFRTLLCVRSSALPAGESGHPVIRTFSDIVD
jgi:enolase-phosphatase E1